MSALQVTIASRALVMIGARPIASMNGTGAEQVAANNLYPSSVADWLSRYRWRFASKIVRLELIAEEPLARYSHQYKVPAEVQHCEIYAVLQNDTPIEFDRFERFVYVDADGTTPIYAEVKFVPNEAYWPAFFTTLIEIDLAAKFAISLSDDTQKAAFFEGKALRQFGLAKTLDSQTRTARKMPIGGLRRYHGGGA